jgi:hypothetical protein
LRANYHDFSEGHLLYIVSATPRSPSRISLSMNAIDFFPGSSR